MILSINGHLTEWPNYGISLCLFSPLPSKLSSAFSWQCTLLSTFLSKRERGINMNFHIFIIKTFSGKFVSVRVDTVDRSGSERLKISGRLAGGRLQFSREITLFVALDCRGDFFNISLRRNNVNAHETFVIVAFVASAFVVALNRPDELAQGACVENF